MQQISETPGLMYAPTYEVDDTVMMAKRQFISSCADDILVVNSRIINPKKQKQPVFKFEDDKISVLDTNNHIHVINAIESSAVDIVKWLNDYDDHDTFKNIEVITVDHKLGTKYINLSMNQLVNNEQSTVPQPKEYHMLIGKGVRIDNALDQAIPISIKLINLGFLAHLDQIAKDLQLKTADSYILAKAKRRKRDTVLNE